MEFLWLWVLFQRLGNIFIKKSRVFMFIFLLGSLGECYGDFLFRFIYYVFKNVFIYIFIEQIFVDYELFVKNRVYF